MPARPSDMTWPAIIEAALFLSGEMGVNHTLWGRACAVMGREYAAVAMAIVSTRPQEHFTSGPGGYFAGMLRKFEKNPADLCLGRTLWKLKDERWGKDGHKERRKVEQRRRIEMRTKKSMHPDLQPAPRFQAHGTGERYKRRFCAGWQRSATTANGLANAAGAAAAQPVATQHIQRRATVVRVARPRGGVDQKQARQSEEELSRLGMNPAAGCGEDRENGKRCTGRTAPERRRIMSLYAPGRGRR